MTEGALPDGRAPMTLTLLTPRQKATNWARRMAADPDTVYLDTETTGTDVATAEIVDIAVLSGDGRVLLDSLCCPVNRIPPEASAIHGLTEKDVHKAPMWKELYPKVAAALRGKTVVAWNGTYDVAVIRRICTADKLPDPIDGWQCGMLAMSDYLGEPSPRGDGFRWPKLAEACAHFGIEAGGHRALGDALACRQVVMAMAEGGR